MDLKNRLNAIEIGILVIFVASYLKQWKNTAD